MALLEKAAEQGHVYAIQTLGSIHRVRSEYEQAIGWFTRAAEAGLPKAMFSLGVCLDKGQGVAAPDYMAAAGWYRRAAVAGDENAAVNLSDMYTVGRDRAWQIMLATSLHIGDPFFLVKWRDMTWRAMSARP